MKPGVYDLSIGDYHSGEGISRSSLREYKKSPLHFQHKHVNKNTEERKVVDVITQRNPLEFGNAFHTFVLENDKYDKEYFVMEKCSRATLRGKALLKEAKEECGDRMLIDSCAHKLIKSMTDQIHRHPQAKHLLKGAAYEKSMYWRDEDTGLLLKARPDIWSSKFIADLKTSADASEHAFTRAVYQYGYHLQCAMIHMGLKTLYNQDMRTFVFIVVEKEAPFANAIYTLSEADLEQGVQEVKAVLIDIKESYDTDMWPSYPSKTISLPKFLLKKEELHDDE